jgi:hypothetical protein
MRFIAWLVLGTAGYIFAAAVLERRRIKKNEKEDRIDTLLGTVFPPDHHDFGRGKNL